MRPQNLPQVNRSREKLLNGLCLWALGSSCPPHPPTDPCESCVFSRGTLPRVEGHTEHTWQRPTLPKAQLTALDGVRRSLQGDDPPTGLWNVHSEHQPHPRVLPADVRLPFPQLDVGVPKLQDPRAIDAARRWRTPLRTDHFSEETRSPTKPPCSVHRSKATASGSHGGRGLQSTDKYFSQRLMPSWRSNTYKVAKEMPP